MRNKQFDLFDNSAKILSSDRMSRSDLYRCKDNRKRILKMDELKRVILAVGQFVWNHSTASSLALLTAVFLLLHEQHTYYGYFGEKDCHGENRVNLEEMNFHQIKYFGLLFGTSSWTECTKTKPIVKRGGPYIGFESERTIVIAYKSETIDEDQPKLYGTGVIIVTLNGGDYIGYTVQFDPTAKQPNTTVDGVFERCPYVISMQPATQSIDQNQLKEKWPNLRRSCKILSMSGE
jgi:hypothetical protein